MSKATDRLIRNLLVSMDLRRNLTGRTLTGQEFAAEAALLEEAKPYVIPSVYTKPVESYTTEMSLPRLIVDHLVDVIEMQQHREDGSFHIPAHIAINLWDKAVVQAEIYLQQVKVKEEKDNNQTGRGGCFVE